MGRGGLGDGVGRGQGVSLSEQGLTWPLGGWGGSLFVLDRSRFHLPSKEEEKS